MKLVVKKSLPLVRVKAVLEYGREKNWSDGAVYEALKEDWTLKHNNSNSLYMREKKKRSEKTDEKIRLEYSEGERNLQMTADLINNHRELFRNIYSEKLKFHNNNLFLAHAESLIELRKKVGVTEFDKKI